MGVETILKSTDYTPNCIPKSERIFIFVWGVGLIAYAILGYYRGELFLPGLRGSEGIVFSGESLYFIMVAMFFGGGNLILTIVDHYDERDNETTYIKISRLLMFSSVVIILLAVGIEFGYFQ